MSTAEKKSRSVSVMPFVIEARTPRNGDLMIQCLGKLRLRGAVRATMEITDKTWDEDDFEDGKTTRSVGAKLIDGIGELPGMHLYVNPAKCEWKVSDPLFKQEGALERIARALSRSYHRVSSDQKLRGMKPQEGKLDKDTMKTLCRELLCFVDAEEARVVNGMKPSTEDIDELPGDYLLNWVNERKWQQPRHEKDYDAWVNRRSMVGE